MKIFLAFGYHPRDRWIPDFLTPIIEAFGDEVVTGGEVQGQVITDAIRREIRESDALIAFTTRRDPAGEGRWSTHRWVTDELSHALAYNLLVVEVRERGVDDQRGIVGDRQPIIYDAAERDKCLVELVKTIGRWHRGNTVKLQLLPDEFVQDIRPFLRNTGLRCTYKLLRIDGSLSDEMPTTILPITGGLFVQARNVPRLSLIQIRVECSGRSWASNFETIDSVGIRLEQE
jgi:hypothetical protein